MEPTLTEMKKSQNSADRMSTALKKKDYLTLLATSKEAKRRKALLEIASRTEIDAISECLLNILSGKVKIPPKKLHHLRKIKRHLRDLTNKRCSFKKRKQILKQKGGFLPTLLPIALSVLGSLFGK